MCFIIQSLIIPCPLETQLMKNQGLMLFLIHDKTASASQLWRRHHNIRCNRYNLSALMEFISSCHYIVINKLGEKHTHAHKHTHAYWLCRVETTTPSRGNFDNLQTILVHTEFELWNRPAYHNLFTEQK